MNQKLQQQIPVEVDGKHYVVQLFQPTFGITLQAKLMRLFGESVVKMIGMFKGQKIGATKDLLDIDLSSMDLDSAGEAMAALFSKLQDDQLVVLIKEILSGTFTDPELEPVCDRFETIFAGRYLHMYKLVAKTLGVQFSDFLSGIVKRKSAVAVASGSDQTQKKGH